jgi:hypothetical protein
MTLKKEYLQTKQKNEKGTHGNKLMKTQRMGGNIK